MVSSSSKVVDHLQQEYHHQNVAVLCIYCSYSARHTHQDLLASLLKQLAQKRPVISEAINKLYDSHSRKGTPVTFSEIMQELKSELQTYNRVYIVIDALDECPRKTRETLLQNLQSLLGTPGTVNLMITARPNTIIKEVQKTQHLEIRADDADVRRYVQGRINHSSDLQELVKPDSELEAMVIETLTSKANGM